MQPPLYHVGSVMILFTNHIVMNTGILFTNHIVNMNTGILFTNHIVMNTGILFTNHIVMNTGIFNSCVITAPRHSYSRYLCDVTIFV